MNKVSNNTLEISSLEKRRLRQHKIKRGSIHRLSLSEIQELLCISKIRAMELSALSEFQSLPSIGIRFALDLIAMGYYSLKDLKGKDGAKLIDNYERQNGLRADPCVEDQFRLAVHFADHPGVHKNWWDFTAERKAFREKNGYPRTRPKKAWYELDQYHRFSKVSAVKNDTRRDLAQRLKDCAKYMNKHYDEKISLSHLSKVAAMSAHHFLRQFKNVYEITPIQYLTNIRLKTATSLLKTTKLSVGRISRQCGFENESSFIRLFKSQFSATPLRFRKSFHIRKESTPEGSFALM